MNNVLSPAEVDLIMERQFGRTGKMMTDLADNKELKNAFSKTREDIATNNKYYADFWSRYNNETGEFNVMRNIRYGLKKPLPGEPGYDAWTKEVRVKAENSVNYATTYNMVIELLKMRDYARLSNNEISVDVYNKMNRLMQGFYDNKRADLSKKDIGIAYKAMREEAMRINYESDVEQFNYLDDIEDVMDGQIEEKTIKLIEGF
jgi:hypothetical protein